MNWSSHLSKATGLEECLQECAASLRRELGEAPPDLLLVFVSSLFRHRYDEVPGLLSGLLPARHVLGCSGGGTIGGGHEVEHAPAVGMTAARLPGVELRTFHLDQADLPDLDGPPEGWHGALGVDCEPLPHFVLLADPFTIDVESLVAGMDFAWPRSAKVGGLASDAQVPGGNALFLDGEVYESGLVGLALTGDIEVDTVVAQGCRPIGEPLVITRCQGNFLAEVDGRPILEVLQELLLSLSERDRTLARHSLFLGLLMDATNLQPTPGDFLVRNLIGLEPEQRMLAVAAELRPGQTVQFHLRDARTSSEDLERMLGRYLGRPDRPSPQGALLFSCLGRGQYLYGEPDHDSRTFRSLVGNVPLAGFFCNGEIGPVGGRTHVHGYTSCFGLFRSRARAAAPGPPGSPP